MSDQAATSEPREKCDHICLKDADHVERGERHFYGYELPSPRRVVRSLDREYFVALTEAALKAHTKRRPIGNGCIIESWECACGEVVEDHAHHVAGEIVADELWATLASAS